MVNVSNKQNSAVIKVTSSNGNTIVTAKADSAQFWSNQSKDYAQESKNWANKLGDTVDGIEYSAKHYANLANSYVEGFEDVVNSNTNNIITTSNDYINQITETANESISNVENKVNEANELVNAGIANINTTKNTAVDDINSTKTNILKDIEFVAEGEKEEIQELAEKAKDDIESTGFYMRDDKLYFINSEGQEEEFKSGDINNKITNCLLEVPQNIKYTLENGTLTLKAGSVVIVPYGTEDLTDDYPMGSIFLTNRFKVIDTQYIGGKFFVWAETQDDNIVAYGSEGDDLCLCLANTGSSTLTALDKVTSGATEPTSTIGRRFWYDTENNYVKNYAPNVTTFIYNTLPIALVNCTEANKFEVNQVFNGMGYIGSTVWIDKGVKGLIPNGRNEDGTLNNIEVTSSKLSTQSYTIDRQNIFFGLDENGYTTLNGLYFYDELNNFAYNGDAVWSVAVCGTYDIVDGKITNFQPQKPFRAVDYNEAVVKSSLTEAQVVVETYKNGTSWYRVYSDGWKEQGGYLSGTSVTFLKQFNDANYTLTYGNTSGQYFEKERFYDLTTAGFKIVNAAYGGGGAGYWYACGY